jgi:hypothetical protein
MKIEVKTETAPSPLESTQIAVDTILVLTQERQALRDALGDLLLLFDRVSGAAPEASRGDGWTWSELQRLEAIRKLATDGSVTGDS